MSPPLGSLLCLLPGLGHIHPPFLLAQITLTWALSCYWKITCLHSSLLVDQELIEGKMGESQMPRVLAEFNSMDDREKAQRRSPFECLWLPPEECSERLGFYCLGRKQWERTTVSQVQQIQCGQFANSQCLLNQSIEVREQPTNPKSKGRCLQDEPGCEHCH